MCQRNLLVQIGPPARSIRYDDLTVLDDEFLGEQVVFPRHVVDIEHQTEFERYYYHYYYTASGNTR